MSLSIHLRVAAAVGLALALSSAARAVDHPSSSGVDLYAKAGALAWDNAKSTATGPIPGTSAGTITGILLSAGDRVTVTASGIVNTLPPSTGNEATPNGNPFPCVPGCEIPSARFGALIGRIGATGPWFLIGANRVFTADRPGVLLLAVNDTIHNDNTGSFSVTVNVSGSTAVCVPGATTSCIAGGRFRVEVAWRISSGQTGVGTVAGCGTPDSSLFWFFAPTNWEMLIKILDGCGINNRYWVFMAATTNVEFTLRITDTFTGAVQQYFNPLNRLSPALADTGAFATCP